MLPTSLARVFADINELMRQVLLVMSGNQPSVSANNKQIVYLAQFRLNHLLLQISGKSQLPKYSLHLNLQVITIQYL